MSVHPRPAKAGLPRQRGTLVVALRAFTAVRGELLLTVRGELLMTVRGEPVEP